MDLGLTCARGVVGDRFPGEGRAYEGFQLGRSLADVGSQVLGKALDVNGYLRSEQRGAVPPNVLALTGGRPLWS